MARASGTGGLAYRRACPILIARRPSPQGKLWAYPKATGRCSYVPSRSSSCTPTSIRSCAYPGSDDQCKGRLHGRTAARTKCRGAFGKTLGPYKSRCAFVPRQMPGGLL